MGNVKCRTLYDSAYAHFILDTQVYRYTLKFFNTYCFSTATVVARTRLSVTLYVHCLSCVILLQPGGYNDIPLITTKLQTG